MRNKPKWRLEEDQWAWLGIFAIDIAATLVVAGLFVFVAWHAA